MFVITGATQLNALAAELGRATVGFHPRVAVGLRGVAEQMAAAVRQDVLAIPTHGTKHTGLREALARAVVVQQTVSAAEVFLRVKVEPTLMPAGQQALPAAMEGASWVHPVYGHAWSVTQEGHPYFARGVGSFEPAAYVAVEMAADEVTRTLRG